MEAKRIDKELSPDLIEVFNDIERPDLIVRSWLDDYKRKKGLYDYYGTFETPNGNICVVLTPKPKTFEEAEGTLEDWVKESEQILTEDMYKFLIEKGQNR